MKMFHMTVPDHLDATLEGYLLDCEITLGQEARRPAVLVCPGGGYLYCSPREGEPVALSYAARGFHAFVLRYSVQEKAAGFAPLDEVSWAVGYIRKNAEAWHIDPEKIAVCGFSAGGHVALASGLMARNRPNAMILGYPATCTPNMPQADFMLKLLEGKQNVTDADAEKYDMPARVTKDAPPMFLTATAEDTLTKFCTLPLVNAYSAQGVNFELHLFQYGPHGYSLANETTADGSSRMLEPAFAQWQELSVQWLHKTFGKPEFVDKSTSKMAGILKEMGFTKESEQMASFA